MASLLREVPCRKSLALHHRLGATVQASLWHFSPKMAMDCYAQLMVLMPLPLPLPLLLLLLLLLVPLYSQTDWYSAWVAQLKQSKLDLPTQLSNGCLLLLGEPTRFVNDYSMASQNAL